MNALTQGVDRRWGSRPGRADDTGKIRLLCFHHAGGSAAMHRRWRRLTPASVELIAVRFPGHAVRFPGPARDRTAPLIDCVVDVIKPLLDQPFACYGFSMGARVAWTLAHTLRDRAMPLPVRLYLACDPAPSTDDGTWPWEGSPGGLEGYLRETGGAPREVLGQPELLRSLLATIRSDLAFLSTHDLHPAIPLDVPIRAFAGVDDPIGTPERVDCWRAETTSSFELHRLPGGHLLSADTEDQIIRTIVQDLI